MSAKNEQAVPKCPLHKKANKACKFCKAYTQSQEEQTKKIEEQRSAAVEKLKEAANKAKTFGPDDKAPLPNLTHFPKALSEKIWKNDFFYWSIAEAALADVKSHLYKCETCDVESRIKGSLEAQPSVFISCVYRLLLIQLTENELRWLMDSKSLIIRCAGYMYVRLGLHQDRYWELLSESLFDNEEFTPFPSRGGESMLVGEFVQQLLAKDKYNDMPLPRIGMTLRKTINKRLVLYDQFRQRYSANLEVLDRFDRAGVPVEVCSPDGDWEEAETLGFQQLQGRCISARVKIASTGKDEIVSIGMVICPPTSGGKSNSWDLTRHRGRSSFELWEKVEEKQRDSAVVTGKDYSKSSSHTLRIGVPFVPGAKRKDDGQNESDDDAENAAREARRRREHQAQMAAIESKYCARVSSNTVKKDDTEGPDTMRLG